MSFDLKYVAGQNGDSALSPVCRLYLRPERMLRAKKVTFLGTARSTFVLR